MAADVSANEPADIVKPDVSPLDRPVQPDLEPAPERPHRARFALIYGVLGLALAAAIVGVVIFAGRAIHPGQAWSSWKPSGGGIGAAKQIAQHIGPRYRLPDGNQLLDIIPKPPSVSSGGQTVPVPFIAVRGPKGKVDQVEDVSNNNSITFSLCGLGQSCSIATGKPSVERAALVRREVLELALYTFKYIPHVTSIVAFMPPPAGTKPTTAVYLQKSDLAQQLKEPLTRTLSPHVPLPTAIPAGEQARVDAITGSKLYTFGLSQTQQGDVVLVLSPLKA